MLTCHHSIYAPGCHVCDAHVTANGALARIGGTWKMIVPGFNDVEPEPEPEPEPKRHHAFNVSVHMSAEDLIAKFHCDHAGGRFSLCLSTLTSVNALYLTGTAAELREFAAKLLDAVTAHEGPSVARTAVDAARIAVGTFPCECRPADAMDPCGHADTSNGCPRHDLNARAEWIEENA